MSTQGKGTYVINSGWSSGSLVFYEKAVGRTVDGDILTIGSGAVTVGGTGQDVDFGWYATGSKSFVLDAGAGTMVLAGLDVTITGDLTIDTEDIALGDNDSLEFGDAADVAITWDATNLTIIPKTDNTGEIQFGNDGTKSMNVRFYGATASYNVLWDMDGDTNGSWNFGADTYGLMVNLYGITTGCGVFWDPNGDSNNGVLAVGASGGSKGVDLYAYGASNGNYLQWDQSANKLQLVGTSTVISVAGTTASSSTSTGSLITAGGLGVAGAAYVGGRLVVSAIPATYTAPAICAGIYGTPIVETVDVDNILASFNFATATNKGSSDTSHMTMYVGCSNTAATANAKLQGILSSVSIAGNFYDAYAVQGHVSISDDVQTLNSGAHVTGVSAKVTIASGKTLAQGTFSALAGILSGAGTITQSAYNLWLYNDDNFTQSDGYIAMDTNTTTVPYAFVFNGLGADTTGHVFASTHNMGANATSHCIRVNMNGATGFIPVFANHDWS